MSLLAEAWQHEQCSVTHDQLVGLLETKLADVREQIAELTAFAGQLEAVHERVAGVPGRREACGPGCGCAPALGDGLSDANSEG